MSKSRLYFFVTEDGKLSFDEDGVFGYKNMTGRYIFSMAEKHLPKLKPNKRYQLTIETISKKRSLGVNAYYWAVVLPEFCREYFGEFLIDEDGKFPPAQIEEMHEILKYQFLKVKSEDNPALEYIRSTASLTGREFWIYLDQIFALFREAYGGAISQPESGMFQSRKETENDEKV